MAASRAPEIRDYILATSLREPDILAALSAENDAHPRGGMQFSPDSAQFLQLLVKLMGAKRCLEIGTFTGYSATALALALPPDGKLIACDTDAEATKIAQRYWKKAGVAAKIELRIGPAAETLDALIANGQEGEFDFGLIDADKTGYDDYYERLLRLLRPGGLIAIDNVLWGGAVADPGQRDASTRALRALNKKIGADPRVDQSLLQIGDGLMLARKR